MKKAINELNKQTSNLYQSLEQRPNKLTAIAKWRWFLFAVLLFLWLGNISTIFSEIGRVRILLSGILFLLFIPMGYSKGISSVLRRRQTVYAIILLFLMSMSWLFFGKRDLNIIRGSIPFLAILIWTTMLIKSIEELKYFKIVLLIVILSLGLSSTIQAMTLDASITRIDLWGYKDPNDLAYIFCWAIPLAVSYLLYSNGWQKKAFAITTVLLSIIAVISSGSRAGFLILSIMLLITISIHIKKRLFTTILFFLIIILTITFVLKQFADIRSPLERVLSLFSIDVADLESVSSLYSRLLAHKAAIKTWLDNPILGIGYGNFLHNIGFFGIAAHNTYLQLLAELGIIGFAAYILLLVSIFKGFLPCWWKEFGLVAIAFGLIAMATNTGAGLHALYLFAAVSGAAQHIRNNSNKYEKVK